MGTQQTVRPDDLDLAIVHALQIRPRVPWTRLGEVLDVDPVTAARRWARLADAGVAWVDGYLSPGHDDGVYAHLEIDMGGTPREDTLRLLAHDRCILSLKQTTGGRDLLAIVGASDLHALSQLAGERIARLPGIRATRVHVITAAPFEGAEWRLDVLDRVQRDALAVPAEESPDAPLSPLDRRIALALGSDGRMPLESLARAADTSVSTARRRLRVLTGNRRLSLRCTLARPLTGYPVSVVFFVSVPARHLDDTVAALRTLPELRMCSITSGPANLVLDLWVRALSDVHMLEAHLENRLSRQELRVVERAVVLRTVKHVGRILDHQGRSAAVAPLNYWDPHDG